MAAIVASVIAVLWLLVKRAAPRLALRFAVGVALLMLAQFLLAYSGVLQHWNRMPPPFMPMMLATFICTTFTAVGRLGKPMASSLPFALLIGYQVFRLPLELLMHQAATEGVMPNVMSYSGYNFDIVTGLTALPVAWLAHRGLAPRWLLIGWNAMGCMFLAAILLIAVAATPTFAAFGPGQLNVWIADAPFVWLPGVLVQAAFFGHLLVWRKLIS